MRKKGGFGEDAIKGAMSEKTTPRALQGWGSPGKGTNVEEGRERHAVEAEVVVSRAVALGCCVSMQKPSEALSVPTQDSSCRSGCMQAHVIEWETQRHTCKRTDFAVADNRVAHSAGFYQFHMQDGLNRLTACYLLPHPYTQTKWQYLN